MNNNLPSHMILRINNLTLIPSKSLPLLHRNSVFHFDTTSKKPIPCQPDSMFHHIVICGWTQRGLFILHPNQRWQVSELPVVRAQMWIEAMDLCFSEPPLTQYSLLLMPQKGSFVWTVVVCFLPVRRKCLEAWSNTDLEPADWIWGHMYIREGTRTLVFGVWDWTCPNTFRSNKRFLFFCLRNVSYRNVFLKLSDVRTVYHCLRSLILRFKNRFFFFLS